MFSYLRLQKLATCLSLKKRCSIVQNLEAVIQKLIKLARVSFEINKTNKANKKTPDIESFSKTYF